MASCQSDWRNAVALLEEHPAPDAASFGACISACEKSSWMTMIGNWDFMKMKISNWIGKNAWNTIYIYIYIYVYGFGFGLEMWCFFVYLLKKGPTQFQIEKKKP